MSTDDPKVTTTPETQTTPVRGRHMYSIVFVSDLGTSTLDGRTDVDKDSFADVIAKARPTLAVALAPPLGEGADWEFQLSFDSLASFEPAALVAQVDQGRWRLGVREKIVERQTGAASPEQLQQGLAAAAAADPTLGWLLQVPDDSGGAAPATPPPGGSILDMVDEPDDRSRVARDVEDIARSAGDADRRIPAGESGRLRRMLERLDRELSAIADALLKHEPVRQLERAWRGLKFLVDRIDFREGVRLALLHAVRDEAVDRLLDHVIEPAFDGQIDTPNLIVFDYACENTPADMELLDYLAQHAQSLPVPVVFPLTAAFFNIKSLRLLKNLPNLPNMIDGWEYAKWRSLRDKPYARALAPVLGRLILRAPYADAPGGKTFACRESVRKISDLLWAHGHLAMAVSAARAFAANGWPTRMYGAEAGRIEDLPVVDNPNDPQSPWGPGDLMLPDRRLDELPAIGINQLVSVKNQDYCMLLGGVSAARPVTTKEIGMQQASLEISLPYQQFSNIISAFLCEIQPQLHGLSEEDIQTKLLGELSYLLGTTGQEEGEGVLVGVGQDPQHPGKTIVQVRIIPPGRIVPGGLSIDFGFVV